MAKATWRCHWARLDNDTWAMNVPGGCVIQTLLSDATENTVSNALVFLPLLCADRADDRTFFLRPIGEGALPTWLMGSAAKGRNLRPKKEP